MPSERNIPLNCVHNCLDYCDKDCKDNGKIVVGTPRVVALDESLWAPHGDFVEPDEVVITDKDIKIIIDYPLESDAVFEYHNDNGFTRRKLVSLVRVRRF